MNLEFGCLVPQGWRKDLPQTDSYKDLVSGVVSVAREAERTGYDSLWVYDHLVTYPNPGHEPCLEAWTTLSFLAGIIGKAKLGQLVTCNSYRAPTLLAKIGASFDNLCRGRLIFGIGAGWYEDEYLQYGYSFPGARERILRLAEAVAIIKSMWTTPTTTLSGKYYEVRSAICEPKTIQKPRPPILIGGSGPKRTLRVVADHADISNFAGSPEEFGERLLALRNHCAKIGRDFDSIRKSCLFDVLVGRSRTEWEQKIERFHKLHAPSVSREEYLRRRIYGTPDECASKLKKYVQMGASYFMFYFPDSVELEPVTSFAEEVIPSLEKR